MFLALLEENREGAQAVDERRDGDGVERDRHLDGRILRS